jgi:hypothetical protein
MSQDQLVRITGVPYLAPSRVTHSTILDYAHIIEEPLGIDVDGLIWSYNCIGMDVNPLDDCADFLTLTKRFDSPSSGAGSSFVVQGGVTCKPFGFDMNDPALRKAFDAIEATGVSTGLSYTVFTGAVDLTGGVAVPPNTALGLLESYGYLKYAGEPIIHLGPGMVSQAAAQGAIVNNGGKLSTVLGTPIAVSAGYETKTGDILDPEQVAYVTGAVVLARSEVVLQSSLNQSNNDAVVLYERLYMAAVDCLVGKVKVKVY